MVGLALEGGGAKGAYQVGAYLALINNGIKFNFIAGTSIGALNSALMVQGDTQKLMNIWLNTTTDIIGIKSDFITKLRTKKLKIDDLKEGFKSIKTIIHNKGIDTEPILHVINEYINEEKIRKQKTKMGLVTVKVKKMVPMELTINDIPKGKLTEYILASCYLPVFASKKIIDDEYYLDGGFYNNLPTKLLENQGCKTIYTVSLGSIGFKRNKLNKDTKIIEIKPKKSLGSMFIFDKDSNLHNIQRGYYDTLKVLKKLDGEDYYFYFKKDKYYDRIIRKVDEELLAKMKKRFKANNNKEILIRLTEHLLKKAKINELDVYDIKKQLKILNKNEKLKKEEKSFLTSCKYFW